jgi:hypothetical protein
MEHSWLMLPAVQPESALLGVLEAQRAAMGSQTGSSLQTPEEEVLLSQVGLLAGW